MDISGTPDQDERSSGLPQVARVFGEALAGDS